MPELSGSVAMTWVPVEAAPAGPAKAAASAIAAAVEIAVRAALPAPRDPDKRLDTSVRPPDGLCMNPRPRWIAHRSSARRVHAPPATVEPHALVVPPEDTRAAAAGGRRSRSRRSGRVARGHGRTHRHRHLELGRPRLRGGVVSA